MGTLSSLNILIVEDNESVRNAISYLLSESKYSVETVNSGEAALDKLQQATLTSSSATTRWSRWMASNCSRRRRNRGRSRR
ncbi:MAG: response regulator [Caldithrix sp.]|nr:MAG: response regulator [Caldithrix sp.]